MVGGKYKLVNIYIYNGQYNGEYNGEYNYIIVVNRMVNINWLVVLTILKNIKVNGKDDPIYYGK